MSAVKNRDGVAELAIRRRLWANGLRFRVRNRLEGKPDIVFPKQRIAIFIDGDLWHGNSWRVRGLETLEAQFPTNTAWWVAKVKRNMERDDQVNQRLRADGWRVLRRWESDVLADPNGTAMQIAEVVRGSPQPTFREIEASSIELRRLASVRPRSRIQERGGI